MGSRLLHEEARLEVLSEPTVESPTARFLSVHLSRSEVTRGETTMTRNKISNVGMLIIGGVGLATSLLSVGLENKGYPEYVVLSVSCIGIAGVLAAGSALTFSWRRTSVTRTVDTTLTKRPIFVEVLDDERVIASLYPDDNGIAEFPVREYLQALPDTIHDLRLTVRTKRPDTLSRSFLLPKGAVIQAREELRAERVRQAQEERERREAEEREKKDERERQARAAAALDNLVASLSRWDRAELMTRFMYADAGFQYLVATGNIAKALGIGSYGEFLNLPLRSQVWTVRELARATCGEGQSLQASLFIQELLHMPAYLTEKILR